MPALKYSDEFVKYEENTGTASSKKIPRRKDVVVRKQSPRKSVYSKTTLLNFALLSVASFLAICFVVVYSIVALNETKLTNLHAQISELNYENVELENKLESIKSFSSIDTKVSHSSDFEKAKNVIELNHVDAQSKRRYMPKNSNLNSVTGF